MSVGFCLHCQQRAATENAGSSPQMCPSCRRPMVLPDAAPPRARDGGDAAPAAPRDLPPWRGQYDTPGSGDSRSSEITAALAQAAQQCAVADRLRGAGQTLRHQAQALRRESRLLREPAGRGAVGFNRQPAAKEETSTEGRHPGDAALVTTELSHDPSSLLPPLDYRLPPLEHALLALHPDGAAGPAAHPLPDLPDPRTAPSTTLYAWGYSLPESPLCRDQCEQTEAAALYAIQEGWDAERPGAWAREICLGLTLSEMLRWVVPILQEDPGVVGWALCMRRTP